MADKQGGEVTKANSESSLLREEIVSLISSRLESIGVCPNRQEILKVLNRRKKKWRKRHKTEPQRPEYQPLDPSLREEKESISFTLNKLTEELVQRRREGFSLAREHQRKKGEYSIDAFSYWLQNTESFIQSCHTSETSLLSQLPQEASTKHHPEHERLMQDLSSAIAQAAALSEIHSMKHDMTPRLPPLQDRTLSGNILDASLGVFNLQDQPATLDHLLPVSSNHLLGQPATQEDPLERSVGVDLLPEKSEQLLKELTPPQQPVAVAVPQQPTISNHLPEESATAADQEHHPPVESLEEEESGNHRQEEPVDHQQRVTEDAESRVQAEKQQAKVASQEEPLKCSQDSIDHPQESVEHQQEEPVNHLQEDPTHPQGPVEHLHDEPRHQSVNADSLHALKELATEHSEIVEINGFANGMVDNVVTEFVDAQLTIGKVVNVEQDNCVYKSDAEAELHNEKSAEEHSVQNETVVLRVDNESSDDTPGVGMEIVCGAASDGDAGMFVVSQSHGTNKVTGTTSPPPRSTEERNPDLDSTYSISNHTPVQKRPTSAKGNKSTKKRRSSTGKAMMERLDNSTDTDSDTQFGKILEIIEAAPYELRIPSKKTNYSATRKRRRSTPRSKGKK